MTQRTLLLVINQYLRVTGSDTILAQQLVIHEILLPTVLGLTPATTRRRRPTAWPPRAPDLTAAPQSARPVASDIMNLCTVAATRVPRPHPTSTDRWADRSGRWSCRACHPVLCGTTTEAGHLSEALAVSLAT